MQTQVSSLKQAILHAQKAISWIRRCEGDQDDVLEALTAFIREGTKQLDLPFTEG